MPKAGNIQTEPVTNAYGGWSSGSFLSQDFVHRFSLRQLIDQFVQVANFSHGWLFDILHSDTANHAFNRGSRRINFRGLFKECFKVGLVFKLTLDQQQIDTTTPSGRLLFQVTGAFGEFERSIIRERVNAGLARAKAEGKTLGRPKNDDAKRRAAVVRLRKQGAGILKIARTVGAGTSYVQRIVAELNQ